MSTLHPLFDALLEPMRPKPKQGAAVSHICLSLDCWCEENICTQCGARPELGEACEPECGREIHMISEERKLVGRTSNGAATSDVVVEGAA